MANFQDCIGKTLSFEGGYCNHSCDKGKETNYGISINFAKASQDYELFDADKDGDIDGNDIKILPLENAILAYKKYFWDKLELDDISSTQKAFLAFDASVNHGIKGAVKLIQKAINLYEPDKLLVDGVYGPKTKKAFEDCDVQEFVDGFQKKRIDLYNAIVKNNPSQKCFLKGWLNRVKETGKELCFLKDS